MIRPLILFILSLCESSVVLSEIQFAGTPVMPMLAKACASALPGGGVPLCICGLGAGLSCAALGKSVRER